jgi:hypothetical protein
MRACSFFVKKENNVLGCTFADLFFLQLFLFITRANVAGVAGVVAIWGIARLGSNLVMSMVVDMYIGAFITYVFIKDGGVDEVDEVDNS